MIWPNLRLRMIGRVLPFLLAACATANAAVLTDRAPVLAGCTPTTCFVTWYFHAVGPVSNIVATVSVNGSTFLHTDTLPATATNDTATVPVLPGGAGIACARSITAPPASASCKPWVAPGAVVTDSVLIGIKAWAPMTTIPAGQKAQLCLFCNRPATVGFLIPQPTVKRPAIRRADRYSLPRINGGVFYAGAQRGRGSFLIPAQS